VMLDVYKDISSNTGWGGGGGTCISTYTKCFYHVFS
jgi:hypothetical protein